MRRKSYKTGNHITGDRIVCRANWYYVGGELVLCVGRTGRGRTCNWAKPPQFLSTTLSVILDIFADEITKISRNTVSTIKQSIPKDATQWEEHVDMCGFAIAVIVRVLFKSRHLEYFPDLLDLVILNFLAKYKRSIDKTHIHVILTSLGTWFML